ncbi:nitrogen regulation protein NR(II) [Corallincola luteus]|uniref:Sensory histidine kinase/phosphatase NtrB n=3 Tax=Corallincola TaxID=1775176 RepID=A0A368NM41_9GAMM|nr:nitrogen regulation protein NR(II) [Corallincola holothuriorum]TAA46101.1 nitrogen regulation protein NR(II) [Corallincola spongiicola]TCI04146.1 nitrogen regulation protein NR(II) [Corallincola luteus]
MSGVTTTLLDVLSTAIILLDHHLVIRYINSAGEQLLEQSSRRLIGEPLPKLFEHLSLDIQLINETLTLGNSFTDSDVSMVKQDGIHIAVDVTVSPFERGDQRYALLELKQIDQQKKISHELYQASQQQAARELVRGLAHEIKNPLGGLRGAAQLLEKELPSPELKEFTGVIIEQADRLRNLVDRLLGPQRPSTHKSHNIHMVLEKVCQLVNMEGLDQLVVNRDYDPSLPDIEMDPEQLEQAVLNIVKNAVEAMHGKGTINVSTRSASQITLNGERYRLVAEIKITDNGPGIPPALQDTLFYPMVTGKADGTGLGLSIAQTLITQHKGRIECISWPGHTEFIIHLPIRK